MKEDRMDGEGKKRRKNSKKKETKWERMTR
jgi:hypothetical protein